mmetsp:Transcript_41552/g.130962  ORF Transcript_41552/g.130962 Transcript_41552/m.130962 type:complete len:289 (-) Transcript_41552:898-1764(-)
MSAFARFLAAIVAVCGGIMLLAAWQHGGDVVVLKQKQSSSAPTTSSVEAQLDKVQEMFNTRQPVPGMSSTSGLPGPSPSDVSPSTSRGRESGGRGGQDRLGLHGMTQASFVRRVEDQVSRRVASALLRTMKPLKEVLREQQQKIRILRRQRNKMEEEQKEIAQKLSTKIKDGLLSHLKQDVDVELKRELKPRDILKYEKSKAALKKKLLALKQHHTRNKPEDEQDEEPEGEEKGADLRSAVKHSMSSALDGVLNEHKKPPVSSLHMKKTKKKCDPLAGLYKTGLVSWC